MKLLVDESLARRVASLLLEAGHDAVHVADLDRRGAPDDAVLQAAAREGRTVVTADTDFGTLLALGHTGPAKCDPPSTTRAKGRTAGRSCHTRHRHRR